MLRRVGYRLTGLLAGSVSQVNKEIWRVRHSVIDLMLDAVMGGAPAMGRLRSFLWAPLISS